MKNTSIDQTDLHILFYLSNHGRISYKDLALKLELSAPAVKYRIDKLIEKNIIRGFKAVIDLNILTPTYQSYILKMSVMADNLEHTAEYLKSLPFFESINIVAASQNIIGITNPLSPENLKLIMELIANQKSYGYELIPLIEKKKVNQILSLDAEKISRIYCPECQEVFVDEDGFIEIVGTKILGFCCNKCRDTFVSTKVHLLEK